MIVALRSHASAASSRIASVLHTAYGQTHLATGGRELYAMIVVYNNDDGDGMIRTFQHQRM